MPSQGKGGKKTKNKKQRGRRKQRGCVGKGHGDIRGRKLQKRYRTWRTEKNVCGRPSRAGTRKRLRVLPTLPKDLGALKRLGLRAGWRGWTDGGAGIHRSVFGFQIFGGIRKTNEASGAPVGKFGRPHDRNGTGTAARRDRVPIVLQFMTQKTRGGDYAGVPLFGHGAGCLRR